MSEPCNTHLIMPQETITGIWIKTGAKAWTAPAKDDCLAGLRSVKFLQACRLGDSSECDTTSEKPVIGFDAVFESTSMSSNNCPLYDVQENDVLDVTGLADFVDLLTRYESITKKAAREAADTNIINAFAALPDLCKNVLVLGATQNDQADASVIESTFGADLKQSGIKARKSMSGKLAVAGQAYLDLVTRTLTDARNLFFLSPDPTIAVQYVVDVCDISAQKLTA